jgi:hypothetical protein
VLHTLSVAALRSIRVVTIVSIRERGAEPIRLGRRPCAP